MKHHSLFSLILTAAATSTILAGCSADPILPDKAELYNREFIKTFGVFDLSHDWNFATQTSVTVTTAAPTDIKVCARFDGTLYSFGEFTNVDGTQTLNVDIPKGITDLIIRANGRNYAVKAGGEIDLNERTPRSSRSSDDLIYSLNDDYKYIHTPVITSFTTVVPENGNNMLKEGLISNFSLISNGSPFTFYPVYWNTNSQHHLGIFWYDADHYGESEYYHEQEIYLTKDGDKVQYYTGETPLQERYVEEETIPAEDEKWGTIYQAFLKPTELGITTNNDIAENTDIVKTAAEAWLTEHQKKPLGNASSQDSNVEHDGIKNYNRYVKSLTDNISVYGAEINIATYTPAKPAVTIPAHTEYGDADKWVNATSSPLFGSDIDYIRTKGVTINLPANVRFGFYIDVTWSTTDTNIYHRCYSSATHNKIDNKSIFNIDKTAALYQNGYATNANSNGWSGLTDVPDNNYSTASYFNTTVTEDGQEVNNTFFAFEDWGLYAVDLNDLIFMIDETTVPDDDEVVDEDEPEPEEPETWEWIIACEDLGTNDFDFNDVVFSVSSPVTSEDNTKTLTVTALAAGGTLPVYLCYGESETIIIPEGCTSDGEFHSWFGDYSSSTVINAASLRATGKSATITVSSDFTMKCCQTAKDGNMGNFKVKVLHADGTTTLSATNPNIESQIGSAPQMICVPTDWCWPRENMRITKVYPYFEKWCENDNDATMKWHETRAASGFWQR